MTGQEIEDATLELGEPVCDDAESSWWYSFTPTATGRFRIIGEYTAATEEENENDVKLGVYTRSGTTFTEVGCFDNDYGAGWGENEQLELTGVTTYLIRVAADVVPGMEDIALSVSTPALVWTGAIDTEWTEAGNWEGGSVPTADDEVYIGPGLINYPVVANASTLSPVSSGFIFVNGGSLTVADDGALIVGGNGRGILVDEGGALAVSGTLLIQNVAIDGIIIDDNASLVISGEAGVNVVDAGRFGLIISGTATFGATCIIGGSEEDGILLSGGTLTVEEAATLLIGESELDGIYLQDDASLIVNGQCGVLRNGEDGIDSPGGRVTIGPTGAVVLLENTEAGFDNADFINQGDILIQGSGDDGMFVGTDSRNEGRLSVTGSTNDGIDVGGSVTLTNADTIVVNTAGEFAIEDGTFTQEATGTLIVDGTVELLGLAAGSVLAPGSSPGCVTFINDQDLSGVAVQIEIDGLAACTDHDRITAQGTMDITNAILELSGSYVATTGDEITLIDKTSAGPVVGTFAGLTEGGQVMLNGIPYVISYTGGDGNDVVLTADVSLPVELISFTGRTGPKQNILAWTSASEANFSHYAVERSPDGHNNWLILGRIQGADAGAMEGVNGYGWEDQAPPPTAYYRLRSVDTDGSYRLSNILLLERATSGKLIAYPNPTRGELTVLLPGDEPTTLELFDLHGKLLSTTVATGWSHLQQLEQPAGVYLLVATSSRGRWTRRISVQ